VVILGNGPSLNEFVESSEDFLATRSKLAVNYFVRSEFYQRLKPNYYLITSPEFWKKEEKEGWSEDRMKTFELLADRTDWDLVFYVPKLAEKHHKWKGIIEANKNIEIRYFNNIPIEGFVFFRNWAFKNNLGMPRPHNVIIPSLMMSINMKYSRIFLAGSEHSWLKELNVTEDNVTLLSQKHFYEKQSSHVKSIHSNVKEKPMYYGGSKNKRPLHDVLEKFYFTFRAYWEIKDFATKKNVSIYNLTKDSYIDAYDKKSTHDFTA
ncbi:MAG: hypothetical protein ACI8XB_002677, partial [Patiriisocius sp.]